jgi:hypothetical protein
MSVVFLKVFFALIGFLFIFLTKKIDDEFIRQTKIHVLFEAWIPTFTATVTRWLMYIIGAFLIFLGIK